jgi:hypothetical protein
MISAVLLFYFTETPSASAMPADTGKVYQSDELRELAVSSRDATGQRELSATATVVRECDSRAGLWQMGAYHVTSASRSFGGGDILRILFSRPG